MFALLKVSGDSLLPDYRDGDFVLINKIPVFFNKLQIGDIIVFSLSGYGRLIKRIDRISADKEEFFVIGDQYGSIDSHEFGWVNRQSILGKVIWHIRKPD